MEVGKLTVQYRGESGKGISHRLRAEGLVPGTCYGAGLEAPVSVALSTKALQAALDPQRRRNTVISLTIEDNGAVKHAVKCMVWDYQVHPIKQVIMHVDLKAIDPEAKVEVEVPVVPQGKHAGAIDGGLLSWDRHSVTVRCRPDTIPNELPLDITDLNIGGALHVSDLKVPEGVEFATATKLTLVTCVAPKGGPEKPGAPEGEAAAAAPAEEKK